MSRRIVITLADEGSTMFDEMIQDGKTPINLALQSGQCSAEEKALCERLIQDFDNILANPNSDVNFDENDLEAGEIKPFIQTISKHLGFFAGKRAEKALKLANQG